MTPLAAADELDALFAAPVCPTVRGERLQVRGVRLDELPAFLRLHAARPAASGAEAVPAWDGEMLELFARLCGRPLEWFASITEDEAETVFAAVQEANRTLFDGGAPRTGARSPAGKPLSWSAAVAQLVECGHTLDAVRGYTLGQVERLLQAHARLHTEQRIDELSIARAAQADRKGFKAAMDALERARSELD